MATEMPFSSLTTQSSDPGLSRCLKHRMFNFCSWNEFVPARTGQHTRTDKKFGPYFRRPSIVWRGVGPRHFSNCHNYLTTLLYFCILFKRVLRPLSLIFSVRLTLENCVKLTRDT